MPDILLIQPPIEDFYLTSKRTIPYGLACIASCLLREGFTVEVLDCLAAPKSRRIEPPPSMRYLERYYGRRDVSPFALFRGFKHFGRSYQSIGESAKESGAFLVGISSLFTPYSGEALLAAEAVKRFHPECKVVLGGHHPTAMPERVMQCSAVDYVIRGEGEAALPALAGAIRRNEAVGGIPGMVFRRSDGTLHVSEPAVVDTLDECPPPAAHLLRNDYYSRGGGEAAVVVASRGCPMQCTYCCVGAGSHLSYRRRSVESVLAEIETAVSSRNVAFIDFEDENISLCREWVLQLLEGIRRRFSRFGIELRAMNGLLPSTLNEEVLGAMKQAGLKVLNLSLGSASEEQMRRFHRPDLRRSFDSALDAAEKLDLEAVGYIIAGAPGQDPFGSVSDLLHLAARRVLAGVSIYYPSPGSEDFRRYGPKGIFPEEVALMRSSAIPISDTTSRDQAVTLLRLGRMLNFMKALIDQGEPVLSHPRECRPAAGLDRIEAGRELLRLFFHDGVIRGIDPNGNVFEHVTSTELTTRFIDGLSRIRMRGAKQ